MKKFKMEKIEVGTQVYDTSGIFEVTDIDNRCNTPYTLNEVVDDEVTENKRYLTISEMKRMETC